MKTRLARLRALITAYAGQCSVCSGWFDDWPGGVCAGWFDDWPGGVCAACQSNGY